MTWAELKTNPNADCLCQFKSHTFGKQQVFLLSLVHKGNSLILEETVDLSPSCCLMVGIGQGLCCFLQDWAQGQQWPNLQWKGLNQGGRHSTGEKGSPGAVSETWGPWWPGPPAMTTVWAARILCVSTATLSNPNASPHPHTVLRQPKGNTVIRDPEVLDCQLQTKGHLDSLALLAFAPKPWAFVCSSSMRTPTLTPLPNQWCRRCSSALYRE